ncbi:hypothetical protein K0M31_016420 [Melipona bicolor]|uniref:Tudor domain-containing protein 7 n=1 Tax=Melipona bicolor TaxID=60889 RepID=A0AA40G8B1_9HYME|nr:hypothetical protein K0M31_016420 [Melipona bicolor]
MYKKAIMEKEEVIKNLRACLISSKGGVKVDDLNRDYKMLIDENIPFRKLGYQSLIAFLRTVSSIRLIEKGNDCFVEAIPTEESAHITKLIARQKTTGRKFNKLINTRKPTPFRQPVTKKNVGRSGNNNLHSQMSGRQNMFSPTSSTKITIHQNSDKPRYIHSNFGVPPNSPSKRLKDKQMNSVLSVNQSINKSKDETQIKNNLRAVTPVISQKPKTVTINVEMLPKKVSNLSDKLKGDKLKETRNIPSLLDIPINFTPSHQSEVLSPLSPGQVLADSNMKFQQSPIKTIPLGNSRKIVPKLQSADPREELKRRAKTLNLLEPVYQICPATIKNTKEPAIFAQVKIGPHGYSSYPEEARTEDEAQKIAAKFALVDLTEKYGSSSCFNETKDKNIIKERVLSIIDAHPNGIFMHQVPIYYKQQYEEILPGNWERTIETSPAIVLEKGVDNSIILRRFTSYNEKMRTPTSLKTDKIQLKPIGPVAPGQLEFPEEDFWIVSVTCVLSTVEIWARIIGDAYSEQFDIMTTKMSQHYNKIQSGKAPHIEIGNYYVVFEDESWHRVRCIDFNIKNGMVTVSFIDHGDEDTFHFSRLQILDKKFCALPAQAIRLCLSGLEDFNDCDSITSEIEKLLLDRALYVEVRNRKKDQNGSSATVVFYDTHGPDDININLELFKQISQSVLTAPKLDVEGQVSEVLISHIEQNGDVYVQVQSESIKLLVNLLNRLVCTGLNTEDLENCIVTTVDPSKTYFVSVNNNWYRGKIVNDSLHNQLRAFLIDFGKTVTITKSNLLSLETLSHVLANYPAQALKVHLHNIDKSMFNGKMVAKLAELAPKNESLLIKVVSIESKTPIVELFKRIQPSNMLVSINNTLALEEELTKTHGDGNNNIKPRKPRVERMNSKLLGNESGDVKSLKPPKISDIGEYFDVHVTMAAHPGNFTIQPFNDKSSLESMMILLQEACQAHKGPTPTVESVKEGKLYAAQHIDSHWYRVCISSIIKENMVSVYFCDFGDVSVLPLNKLQPLKSEFLELPYQAIKARLVGIRPINVDWSVEDSLRFQELVVDKNFVSIVVESKPDGFSPADTVLGLKLIDVNTAEDIYIDRLLVEEGRATFID